MRQASTALALIAGVLLTAASSAAQTITTYDMNGPRLGGSVSYGGHGLDWEMSLDSRTLWNRVQFRATLGQGRWVGSEATLPPAGNDPTVTRAALSIIRNGPFDPFVPVRPYGGVGLSALVPRGVDMNNVIGLHAFVGIEAVGQRWSFGPELQFDVPARVHNSFSIEAPGSFLYPTARIGFFARRLL
jgi:hypothetical protein